MQHLALVAVVDERPRGQRVRRRPLDRPGGDSGGQLPLECRRQAGIARVLPVRVPAFCDRQAAARPSTARRERAPSCAGDQLGLDVLGAAPALRAPRSRARATRPPKRSATSSSGRNAAVALNEVASTHWVGTRADGSRANPRRRYELYRRAPSCPRRGTPARPPPRAGRPAVAAPVRAANTAPPPADSHGSLPRLDGRRRARRDRRQDAAARAHARRAVTAGRCRSSPGILVATLANHALAGSGWATGARGVARRRAALDGRAVVLRGRAVGAQAGHARRRRTRRRCRAGRVSASPPSRSSWPRWATRRRSRRCVLAARFDALAAVIARHDARHAARRTCRSCSIGKSPHRRAFRSRRCASSPRSLFAALGRLAPSRLPPV